MNSACAPFLPTFAGTRVRRVKLIACVLVALAVPDAIAAGCQDRPYYAPAGGGTVEKGNGYGPGLGMVFERPGFKMIRVAVAAPPAPTDVQVVVSWRLLATGTVKLPPTLRYRLCGESPYAEVPLSPLAQFGARASIPGQPACVEVELPALDLNGEVTVLGAATLKRAIGEFCVSSY